MLMIGGTLTNYVKTLELTHKMQQRIYNPASVQEEESGSGNSTIDQLRQQAEQEQKAARIGAIATKLRTGLELSDHDLGVLRKENPQLYQEAMKVAYERRAYEKKLNQCRTKDEVQRVKLQRMQAFASEAKGIHQSSMPQGAKEQQMDYVGMRMAAIRNEHTKFVNSKRYAQLPTEEELRRKKKEKSEGTAGEQRRRELRLMMQQRDPERQKLLDKLEREARDASRELFAAEADEKRAKAAGSRAEEARAEEAKRAGENKEGAEAWHFGGKGAPKSAAPGVQPIWRLATVATPENVASTGYDPAQGAASAVAAAPAAPTGALAAAPAVAPAAPAGAAEIGAATAPATPASAPAQRLSAKA